VSFIVQRLIFTIITALLTTFFIFSLLHLVPGSPVTALAPPGLRAEQREALVHKYGLDQPILVQYVRWLGNALRGDLGRSLVNNEPVGELLSTRFSNSIKLALLAVTISGLIGILTGIIAAIRRGSLFDILTMTVAIVSFSVPSFWLGVLLMLVFSVHLQLLPTGGVGSLRHLVLPSLSLGAGMAALIARMTRASMLEVLNAQYVMTARSKGLPEMVVTLRHALKNALIPVITSVGQTLGLVLSGAVVTETVFNYPGLGFTLVKSLSQRDYPTIQGALLIASVSYLIVNVVVDLLYVYVDPRIRIG
jgi:peptide/nickel transport system permease protein